MIKQKIGKLFRKFGLINVAKPIPPSMPVEPGSYYEIALAYIPQLQNLYYSNQAAGRSIDSMTTQNELAFLRAYGKDLFTGLGKIIDLGCWFGATSAALAEGLSENSRSSISDIVEAYDLFDWEGWMDPIKDQIGMKAELAPGDCFLSIVENNLSDYGTRIILHKQDLSQYTPPADWKIEFLFVDAMKNWSLADIISRSFFTKMIGGESLVVMQDFAFYDPIVATNHLIMWHLRDFFVPLHHVPDSCSMVFMTSKTPALSDLMPYAALAFDEADIAAAYEYCLPLVQESMQSSLKVARLCHHLLCQHQQGALQAIDSLAQDALTKPMMDTIERCCVESYDPPTLQWQTFQPDLRAALHPLLAS